MGTKNVSHNMCIKKAFAERAVLLSLNLLGSEPARLRNLEALLPRHVLTNCVTAPHPCVGGARSLSHAFPVSSVEEPLQHSLGS